MKRLLVLIGLAAALFFLSGGCASTLPSVVNYDPVSRDTLSVRYSGSGFVWNGRYILTSSHSCHQEVVDVVLPGGLLNTQRMKGLVLARRNDVALIDLGRGRKLEGLPLAPRDPHAGQKLTILDGSRSSRPALEAIAISPDTLRLVSGEKNIRRGSSGSPVVDEEGAVVGMVFASLQLGGRELVSIHPVSEILAVLEGTWGLEALEPDSR